MGHSSDHFPIPVPRHHKILDFRDGLKFLLHRRWEGPPDLILPQKMVSLYFNSTPLASGNIKPNFS